MGNKILVVDDDVTFLLLVKDVLKDRGLEVTAYSSADEALQNFSSDRPDLILLDIMLPGLDGLSMCRRLREVEKSKTPVIFLTAKEDLSSRLQGFRSGGQDYIQKPVSIEELCARIDVHLDLQKEKKEFTQKTDELAVRERIRRDLTDMIVHDLKHPLTCIYGTMSLVRKRGLITDERFERMLTDSEKMADMMLLMINDILDIGHAEQVGLEIETGPVEVDTLLQKAAALFLPGGKGIAINIAIEEKDKDAKLESDFKLLFRILANIISNAKKFSPRSGSVDITFSRNGHESFFIVEDRGEGIPECDKKKIFDKYVRGTSERCGGSGVGLAFCRLATAALGGSIRVEDREGGGSRFVLTIPNHSPKDA